MLFADMECVNDPDTGALICPNGCKRQYDQPPYESPFDQQ
jgi:hypothetical protein